MQGLEYLPNEDLFIESSGLYGKSKVQKLAIDGIKIKPVSSVSIDKEYFCEGVTTNPQNHTEFLVLTWRENTIFTFTNNLEMKNKQPLWNGLQEGWGMTHIDAKIYASDGTSTLTVVDSTTFETDSQV